jgi:hypothetical protein
MKRASARVRTSLQTAEALSRFRDREVQSRSVE